MPSSLTLVARILGDETSHIQTPIWIPNTKQPIGVLRQVITRKLFPKKSKSSKCRLFFNGHELEDEYSVAQYDLQEGNVILVKQDNDDPRVELSPEVEVPEQPDPCIATKRTSPDPPHLTSDLYYTIHDHIDALDDDTGAWFPGQIDAILVGKDNTTSTYLVNYRKPSLGFRIPRSLSQIRPQSYQSIAFTELYPGQSVLVLVDQLWYVALVERIHQDYRHSRTASGKLWLSLVRGGGQQRSGTVLEQHVVKYRREHILKLEHNMPRAERDAALEEIVRNGCKNSRYYQADCPDCQDDPRPCRNCGCQICFNKDSPEAQLLCDECDRSTHLWCLQTPLDSPPLDTEWYCDNCRTESTSQLEQIRRSHLEGRKATAKSATKGRWGFGMTCAGRSAGDPETRPPSFGPIADVPVGAWWRFRVQAAQAGVHRPLVAGIDGKESQGAYSIVFSAAYAEDVDLGEELWYTATGGREAKRRTSRLQVTDQKLTRGNKALAMNCAATFSPNTGASAGANWRNGRPVRVLRSGNGRATSRSRYLPKIGIRYDGLYKVVKYWAERSDNGHILWRFHLRRDDHSPAPWTEAGRYQAKKNGYLTPRYPEGWTPEMAEKRRLSVDLKYIEKAATAAKKSKSNQTPENDQLLCDPFVLPDSILALIHQDSVNAKKWTELLNLGRKMGKVAFFNRFTDHFTCICCLEPLLKQPVTIPECAHSFCRPCLARAITESALTNCPLCRSASLASVISRGRRPAPVLLVNDILEQILVAIRNLE